MKDFGSSAGTIAAEPSIAFQVRRDQPRQPGDGIRVLVIEDSFMIVSMLEMVFEGFGWTMAGPATRVATALELVQSETYDVALLDLNLDGEMSWPVAAALRARGVPFALCTGYDIGPGLPDALTDSPVIRKPYLAAELQRVIEGLLA